MALNEIELKMLSELIKNSRRSDRELAKAIGVSQPTATRLRSKLEKEGYAKEYTMIPDFSKIGYNILAFNFVKLDLKTFLPPIDSSAFKEMHYRAFSTNPGAVLLDKRGMGMKYDAVIVSLHPDYSSCDKFRAFIRQTMAERIVDLDTFLVNLDEEENGLPFTFKLLATQVLGFAPKKKEDSKKK